MPRYRTVLMLALASFCCAGCQKEPTDTRALDERAIREADGATLKAAQANDVDGAVANYADDASWLPPNSSLVHGKAPIRARMGQADLQSRVHHRLADQSIGSRSGGRSGLYDLHLSDDPGRGQWQTDYGSR